MEFILELSEQQAEVMRLALELWARVGCGELTALLGHPDISKRLVTDAGVTTEDVHRLLEGLKTSVFGLADHAYYGIMANEISESNRVAYDLMQVIRHRLAWSRAGNPATRTPEMVSTHFDDPMKTASMPLPVMREKPREPV